LAAYAVLELKFVWAILQGCKIRKGKGQQEVYVFNKKQKNALEHLWEALEELENDNDNDNVWDAAVLALRSVFDQVYFPEGYETKKTDFDMPSSTFLATQCITVDGTYTNIHHIPPIMAKLQYSFRLRAACKLMALRLEISVDNDFFM
jgi:hypothetical protein